MSTPCNLATGVSVDIGGRGEPILHFVGLLLPSRCEDPIACASSVTRFFYTATLEDSV